MRRSCSITWLLLSSLMLGTACSDESDSPDDRTSAVSIPRDGINGWKEKWPVPWSVGTDPSRFFDDPKVVECCLAIAKRDYLKTEQLIREGVDPNVRGRDGMTLLMWLMPCFDSDVFELLLTKGTDPNVPIEEEFAGSPAMIGFNVLAFAARFGRAEEFAMILEHGGDANFVSAHASELSILLDCISRTSPDAYVKVALLLEKGADPCNGGKGYVPLIAAVDRKLFRIAALLLKKGANPDQYDARSLQVSHSIAKLLNSNELDAFDRQRLIAIQDEVKHQGAWIETAAEEIFQYDKRHREVSLSAARDYAVELKRNRENTAKVQ